MFPCFFALSFSRSTFLSNGFLASFSTPQGKREKKRFRLVQGFLRLCFLCCAWVLGRFRCASPFFLPLLVALACVGAGTRQNTHRARGILAPGVPSPHRQSGMHRAKNEVEKRRYDETSQKKTTWTSGKRLGARAGGGVRRVCRVGAMRGPKILWSRND
nr:hypothetical protein [Pandoravirus massiliensis]